MSVSQFLRSLVSSLLGAALLAAPSLGQGLCQGFAFEQLPVDKEAQRLGAARLQVLGASSLPTNTADLEQYYTGFLLPQLTNCAEFDNLGDIRASIQRDVQFAKTAAAKEKVAEICLAFCKQILDGNFHRYSKLNAALIIASLDTLAADGSTATPYPPAAQALVDAFVDENAYLEVRITAADGINRHAATLTDEQKSAATTTVVALLTTPEAPKGVDETGYQWLRASTASLAGALGEVGPEAKVLDGLRSMLANEEMTPTLRCNAARAIGGLDYSNIGEVSLSGVAADLAQFCVDAYDHEEERTSGLGQPNVNRPAIRMYVASIVEGLKGPDNGGGGLVAAAAQGPDAENVQRVVGIADNWATLLDDGANLSSAETKWQDIRSQYLQLKEAADNLR